MLKVEHPIDYLKKEGVNSEIFDLLKEEQRIEQQAWKRKSILKRLKRSDDYDQQHGWQTLEDETAKGNYRYWLQEHDIAHIARVEFGYDEGYRKVDHQTQISEETESGKVFYGKTSSKTVFVISDLNSLAKRLANFKDYINERNELRTLTTVINLGGGHWVTLVVAHQNGQYYAYYSDSLGNKITRGVEKKLKSEIADSVYIIDFEIKQQKDTHNCGIFALENSNVINEALQQNKPLDEIIEKLNYNLTDEQLKEKRKYLAENLLKNHARRRFVIVLSTAQQEKPDPSNSELEQASGLSSDRVKRVDNSPNQVGSSQQSSSDNSQSGPSGDNRGSQPDDNLKPDTGKYPASGLKDTLHGNVYQLKLLMLFLNRATRKGYEFSLATEMKSAEKFDDLVFQYIDRNERKKVYRFLQAKHIDDSKKISENDLITEKDDKFSLQKYLISYKKVKKNTKFSGENNKLEDFVICTNIDFDQGLIKKDDTEPQTPKGKSPSKEEGNPQNLQFEEVSERDNILGQRSKKYKITLGEEKDNPVIEILKSSSYLRRLTKKLANYILEGKEINLKDATSDGLFNSYHFILAEKIIDTSKGKFKQEFFSSDEKDIKVFREVFLEAVLEQDLEIKEFEVAVGNKFSDEQINSVVKELVKKIEDNQKVERKRITFNAREYNTRSPDKNKKVIADNPQILQFIFTRKDKIYDQINKKTKYTQSFSDYFLKGCEKLLEKFPYVKEIRSQLEEKLSGKGIDIKSLKEYKVEITGGKFQFVKGSDFCLYSEEAVKNLLDMKDKLPTGEVGLGELAKGLSIFLTNSQPGFDDIKRYYNLFLNQGIISSKINPVREGSREDFLPVIKINFNSKELSSFDLGSHLKDKLLKIFEDKVIKLLKSFGNTSPTITDKKKFINKFVSLVKQSEDRIIEIEIDKNTFDRQNIDALAGHVLSIQDNKIKFNSNFLERDLPTPLKDLRDELKKKFPNFKNNFLNYEFEIEGFTCQSALPNDYITEDDIKEFFSKLRFAVNQPNEVKLGEIIAKEMGEEFNLLDSDFIYSDFQRWMLDWFKKKEGVFLTSGDGKRFFEEVRGKIAKLVSIGPTLLYHKKIEKYSMTFNEGQISKCLKRFLNFNDKFKVFNLIVEDTTLGAIEVYGALKVIAKYSKDKDQDRRVFTEDSHIFLNLENLLILQERVLQAFKSKKNDLLIIECKSTEVPKVDELYVELKGIIDGNPNKRIVLITKSGDNLARKFESDIGNDKYRKVTREYDSSYFEHIGELLKDKLGGPVLKSLEEKEVIENSEKKAKETIILKEEPNDLISLKVLSGLINSKTKIDKDYKYLDFCDVFSEHDEVEDILQKTIKLELPIDRTIAEYITANFIIDLLKREEDHYKYKSLHKLLFAEIFKDHSKGIYEFLEKEIAKEDDDALRGKWKEIQDCDLLRGVQSSNSPSKEKRKTDFVELKEQLEGLKKEFNDQPAAKFSKIVEYLFQLREKGLKVVNADEYILVLDPAGDFKYELSIEHKDKIVSLINWKIGKINNLNPEKFKGEVQNKIKEILESPTEGKEVKVKVERAMKIKVAKVMLDSGVNIDTDEVQELRSQLQSRKSLSLECLPGENSSRRKREAISEKCLFTWEDVDEFNLEKDEKRDFSKIKIDGEKFISYIKDLPEEKQVQLIQLASGVKVTGESQSLVNKLVSNQKFMNHLGRVGRVSGMTMHGMMAKNVLAGFLNGNYQGVAVNVGFIAGGQGFAKVAEAASLKGLKLASEGKLLLGRSLRAASPFLARGTFAFVIYDLVNQVKAFKNGTEEAMVGVVGDSIYLGVDAAEIGVEIAEAFEVLEGVSSVTGPIGAAIGAVVFVGTDVYIAVKRVDKIDEIIHLTGKERFVEGLRAFIGMQPEEHIQELMQEKQLYNQLVKQRLEYLQQHDGIQSYVFPTGKSVVDSCHRVPYKTSECNSGGLGGGCFNARTVTRYAEECTTKFEVDLDNTVLLDRKRADIKWSRAKPDNPKGGQLFCLPQGGYRFAPSYGSYLCKSAIGITDLSTNKTGNHTLIDLGEGEDYAEGFIDSPNIFVVNNGYKQYQGGSKDDVFILQGDSIKGYLYGEGGINTLDLTGFALKAKNIDVVLNRGDIIYDNHHHILKAFGMNKVFGRKDKVDRIFSKCDTHLLDGKGGAENNLDVIVIDNNNCTYKMQMIVRPNTIISNRASKGDFYYTVPYALGSAEIDFSYSSELLNSNNTFFFEYSPADIKNVSINVFNKTSQVVTFNFSPMSDKEFNITISGAENPVYRLGNSTEIKVGNRGNLYMLENTNKSVDKIIKDYLVVANRLNKMSFFIQSLLGNETVVIGSGNYEVIHNNPLQKSHLVGNGGENVYVIDSESKRFETPLPEVVIYDLDVESSVDTIDLRNLVQQAKGKFSNNFKLQVLKSANDLLLKATVEKPIGDSLISEKHEYFSVRLKDGINWYNKTHVIMDNVPMRISLDNDEWSLKPLPLVFEKDKEVIIVTSQDIEENTELITPKRAGNYSFVRDNGSDLMITNAFDANVTRDNLCTIVLSKFYETPKMETSSIKFADKEIILKDHQEQISSARDVNVVKKEHKDQVYNDVFNHAKSSPEVMVSDQPHRHKHSRQHIRNRRMVSSSGTRPSSWINDLFGWVKSSIGGLLSSALSKETSSTPSSMSQVDAPVDVNGTIMLLDVLIRKVTGQKYISTADQHVSLLEAQGYALNITEKCEKVVEQAALKSGVSMHRLNIDFAEIQKEVTEKIMSGKFNEISGVLSSYVEKACPGGEAGKLNPKKFDKFMVTFNNKLDVSLNQSIHQMLHNENNVLKMDNIKEPQSLGLSGPRTRLGDVLIVSNARELVTGRRQ